MYSSASAVVGLLGLASISAGLPTGNTTAPALPETTNAAAKLNITTPVFPVTNGTGDASDTGATEDDLRQIIPIIAGGPGPVVFPNDTEQVNDTSATEDNLPQIIPIITSGPGPVVFRNDTVGGRSLWLEGQPKKSRRLTPKERRSQAGNNNNNYNNNNNNNNNNKRGPGDPLPPRDRTLADHMENYGGDLPECYKRCMRSEAEDGKSSIHMGKDTLGTICGPKRPMFAWWGEHQIWGCVQGENGCQGQQPHSDAYRWLRWTCGLD